MRRLSLVLAAVFVLPLIGSDSPKGYDDRAEEPGIEGTWRAMTFEYRGDKRQPERQSVITFCGGTLTCDWSDGDLWQGNYRIDPSRKPPYLDWIPSKGYFAGKTLRALYERNGDTLRIVYLPSMGYDQRPQSFNDYHVLIWTYQRVKK
jgi:uncharacterized protein (TIGR03067 family)